MSVQLAIANIALDTAVVSRQGFGTLLFVGKHNYFSERVRTYTNTLSMAEDGIPTDSSIYVAAQGAFSQSPAPASIKIGRQETTSVLSPTTPVNSLEYKVTIAAKDAVTAEFTYVATVPTDDEEAVVDALKALIDADVDIAAVVTTTKVGAGVNAVLELSQTITDTDWFTVSLLTNLTETFSATSTESPADTIAAIQTVDDAWYYFHAEDKSNTFILGAAADLEAKLKVYRTSVDEASALAAPSTGTPADLLTAGYFRTQCFFHHEATTKFPEVNATAEIASYTTGAVTYANRVIAAVSPSENALGNPITATQQVNLKAVNCDYFARAGSFASDPVITVIGKVAAGEWLDNIVGRDNMQVDMETDLTNLLISQKSGKIAFNNKGAGSLRATVQNVLINYTEKGTHNFIEDEFSIVIPDQADFLAGDKATRTFTQLTFTAQLTNAIHMVVITGTLSL